MHIEAFGLAAILCVAVVMATQANAQVVPVSLTYQELSAPSGVLYLIRFQAETSSAEQIVAARWDFGDGTGIFAGQAGVQSSASHEYLSAGTFEVTFTAIDIFGSSGSITQSIALAPIPEPEIYAMLGMGLGLLGWVGRKKKLKERTAV